MEATEVFTLGKQDTDRYLSCIKFYREIERADVAQYELILSRTTICLFQPGETVWRSGDVSKGFFTISRGNLLTSGGHYAGADRDSTPVPLAPGEIIGDIAMFIDGLRDATVIADPASKEIALVSTDFHSFGSGGIGHLTLSTKLSLYRILVNNIRWKLELAKMQVPGSSIARTLRKVPIFKGKKGTEEELTCLLAQGKVLAGILRDWNKIPTLNEPINAAFRDTQRSNQPVDPLKSRVISA